MNRVIRVIRVIQATTGIRVITIIRVIRVIRAIIVQHEQALHHLPGRRGLGPMQTRPRVCERDMSLEHI